LGSSERPFPQRPGNSELTDFAVQLRYETYKSDDEPFHRSLVVVHVGELIKWVENRDIETTA
jgi:hypothetical protein